MSRLELAIAGVRKDFPILKRISPSGSPLIYLDSAATALKPRVVIDAVQSVLSRHTANIHRSVHFLGDEATQIYEDGRKQVADFIGAEEHEVVFVRNTTEALNLVAKGWRRSGRIVTSLFEHHSNFLPWPADSIRLNPLPDGSLDMDALRIELQKGGVSLVSVSHLSNVTGALNDVKGICELAHSHGAALMVDAAQSVPHMPVDVYDIGCDFLAFSAHKLGGPTGIGVLFGKSEKLSELDWHLQGGSTVEEVHVDRIVPKQPPWKFEAGTPPIEAVAGLAAAIGYLQSLGMPNVNRHHEEMAASAFKCLRTFPHEVKVLGGDLGRRFGPISLSFRGVSPHTLARGLSDRHGICARSGFHCAQPLHEFYGVAASLRFSFYVYNLPDEVEKAFSALEELIALTKR